MSDAAKRASSALRLAMTTAKVEIDLNTLNELLLELADLRARASALDATSQILMAEPRAEAKPDPVVEAAFEPEDHEEARATIPTVFVDPPTGTGEDLDEDPWDDSPPEPKRIVPECDPAFDREWMAKSRLDPTTTVQVVRHMVQREGDKMEDHAEALSLKPAQCLAVARRFGGTVVRRLRRIERACERDAVYAELLGRLKKAAGGKP